MQGVIELTVWSRNRRAMSSQYKGLTGLLGITSRERLDHETIHDKIQDAVLDHAGGIYQYEMRQPKMNAMALDMISLFSGGSERARDERIREAQSEWMQMREANHLARPSIEEMDAVVFCRTCFPEQPILEIDDDGMNYVSEHVPQSMKRSHFRIDHYLVRKIEDEIARRAGSMSVPETLIRHTFPGLPRKLNSKVLVPEKIYYNPLTKPH